MLKTYDNPGGLFNQDILQKDFVQALLQHRFPWRKINNIIPYQFSRKIDNTLNGTVYLDGQSSFYYGYFSVSFSKKTAGGYEAKLLLDVSNSSDTQQYEDVYHFNDSLLEQKTPILLANALNFVPDDGLNSIGVIHFVGFQIQYEDLGELIVFSPPPIIEKLVNFYFDNAGAGIGGYAHLYDVNGVEIPYSITHFGGQVFSSGTHIYQGNYSSIKSMKGYFDGPEHTPQYPDSFNNSLAFVHVSVECDFIDHSFSCYPYYGKDLDYSFDERFRFVIDQVSYKKVLFSFAGFSDLGDSSFRLNSGSSSSSSFLINFSGSSGSFSFRMLYGSYNRPILHLDLSGSPSLNLEVIIKQGDNVYYSGVLITTANSVFDHTFDDLVLVPEYDLEVSVIVQGTNYDGSIPIQRINGFDGFLNLTSNLDGTVLDEVDTDYYLYNYSGSLSSLFVGSDKECVIVVVSGGVNTEYDCDGINMVVLDSNLPVDSISLKPIPVVPVIPKSKLQFDNDPAINSSIRIVDLRGPSSSYWTGSMNIGDSQGFNMTSPTFKIIFNHYSINLYCDVYDHNGNFLFTQRCPGTDRIEFSGLTDYENGYTFKVRR